MESALIEILGSIYFWIFIGSLLGGLLTLRMANSNRDLAAFADFPDKPEKYIFRSRIFYLLSILFSLAVLFGLVVTGVQVFRVVQPEFSFDISDISAAVERTPVPTGTTLEAEETAAIVEDISESPTPDATSIPTPTPGAEEGTIAIAVIGNTNFQGVNVRSDPSLSSEIVSRLSNQTKVFVFSEPIINADNYNWRKVRLESGEIGWIAEPFLIFNGERE